MIYEIFTGCKNANVERRMTWQLFVNTNISSLVSQRNLTNATNSLNSALQRMSTGYKINSAKDDAAGLYIATNLDTQIRGSKVAAV